MQMLRFALRNLWRDLKSGELSVLLLALCVAVLSLTAVGFFTSRISQGVRAQAAEVLAADLRLESAQPDCPRAIFSKAASSGSRARKLLTFPTAIFNGEVSQLAALNAVTPNYPLRGHVRIADTPFGVARVTDRIPGPRRGVGRRADHGAIEDRARRADCASAPPRFGVDAKCSTTGPIKGRVSSISHPPRCINYADVAATAADPARQPRHLCGLVRRRCACRRRIPRVSARRPRRPASACARSTNPAGS